VHAVRGRTDTGVMIETNLATMLFGATAANRGFRQSPKLHLEERRLWALPAESSFRVQQQMPSRIDGGVTIQDENACVSLTCKFTGYV